MAESIRFDFLSTGAEKLARDFKNTGDNAAAAARGAKVLSDIIGKLGEKENRTAAESRLLARALRETGDAEDRAAAKAVLADAAIRRLDDAMKANERDALEAAAANRLLGDSFDKIAEKAGPSGLGGALTALTPALVPLAGGLTAGIAAVGASFGAAAVGAGLFGVAAKSVLADASTNAQKLQQLERRLNTATTPAARKAAQQQIDALKATWSKGYLDLLGALEDFKGKWTQVSQDIAVPALTVWLHTLTDAVGFLKPAVAPVAALFTSWGKAIDRYFTSSAGSAEMNRLAAAFGRFSADQLSALGVFFTDVGRGVFNLGRDLAAHNPDFGAFATYLDRWGGAFARWSASAAARQDVNKFLAYIAANGPVVRELLKNLGSVLAAFSPGLSSLGQLELRLVSDFLGLLAKTPKAVAQPLTEVAGALLLLQKIGVLKLGIQIVGAAAKLLTGGAISLGGGAAAAGEIRAAFASGGAAAAAEIRAALAGGGAAAGAAGAEGVAGAAAGQIKSKLPPLLVPVASALGPILAGVTTGALIKGIGDTLSPKGTFAGNLNRNLQQTGTAASTSLLHSFTFGGLESWLAAKFGIPVGKVINNTLGFLSRQSKTTTAKVGDDFAAMSDVVKAKTAAGMAAAGKAMAAAGTRADYLRIRNLGPLGSKIDAVSRQTLNLGGSMSTRLGAGTAAGGGHVDAFRTRNLGPLGSKLDAVNRETLTLQGSISSLHGKTVNIGVHGSGSGGARITVSSVGGGAFAGKLVAISNRAAGGIITGGTAGRDSVPAMLMPGEVVVPTRMVKSGAVDHLRGRLPGFAAGGLVRPSPDVWGGRVEGSYGADGKSAIGQVASAAFKAVVSSVVNALKAAIANPFAGITGVPSGGKISGSAAAAQAYAKSILWAYGWGQNQFPPLQALWNGESGWRWNALNPSSGAYGIPQALPASKMAAAGADWRTNPATQIRWGLGYIKNTPGYGSPAIVYAKWLARSPHWYDQGGMLPTGVSIAVNNTGRPEQVIPAGRGGAGEVHLHLTVNGPVGSQQQLEDWYVRTANKMARTGRLAQAVKTASR